MMMRSIWAGLCFLLGLSACQVEHDSLLTEGVVTQIPSVPFTQIKLKEVQYSDAQPVTFTQTYRYDESAHLVSVEMLQRFTAVEFQEIKQMMTFTYAAQQVCLLDDYGNQWTYQLDAVHGRAVSCHYLSAGGDARNYQFSYWKSADGKFYLSEVIEHVVGLSVPFATLYIDYTQLNKVLLTKSMHGREQQFIMNFCSEDDGPNEAQLPPLFYVELYPLSQHIPALYAHLLGDAYDFLLESVMPAESVYGETCTYSYVFEDTYPISCDIRVNSEGETYMREISFSFEK